MLSLKDVFPGMDSEDKETLVHGILMNLYKKVKEYPMAIDLLRVLYEESHPEPLPMNKLQIRMAISQYKLYEELGRLEGAGFIYKELDAKDRRITNVFLTLAGLYVLEKDKK